MDLNSGAPKDGADNSKQGQDSSSQSHQPAQDMQLPAAETKPAPTDAQVSALPPLDEIVRRLRIELEPVLRAAAFQAAVREHERTREWLENRGLPKAARVAQREAFNVLRSQGMIKDSGRRGRAGLTVGQHEHASYKPKLLTPDEIKEVAEICVSMLEGHGQPIDVTLAQISAEAGGYLLAEDSPRVRELAKSLADQKSRRG